MRFNFNYPIAKDDLAAALSRVDDFLKEHGAEAVSSLEISCYPWRNGKRLQALNQSGYITPIIFDPEPNVVRGAPAAHNSEPDKLTIRERPDGPRAKGLAFLMGGNE